MSHFICMYMFLLLLGIPSWYIDYVTTLMRYDAQTNLKVLNMIDFDAILEMDWLFPYHAILNCHNSLPTLISNSHDPKTQVIMTPILDGISFFLHFIL